MKQNYNVLLLAFGLLGTIDPIACFVMQMPYTI